MNVEFMYYDGRSYLLDAKCSLSGGFNTFRLSERFTDLVLDFPSEPTLVEVRSWSRLKSSIELK